MPNLRVYPSGFTAYTPAKHPRVPPPASHVSGWSVGSTQSMVRWLYSVIPTEFSGRAFSLTLTVRTAPSTPDHWKRLRESFFRRLHHLGITSVFWLTEWQRRGVPHLHGIVILPCKDLQEDVLRSWVKVAAKFGAELHAQNIREIYDVRGWNEYLAKHSARGVKNYQRANSGIPAEWQGKTGRMWGYRGTWPTAPPMEFTLDPAVFFRLRRLVRSKAVSVARARQDWKALGYARRTLKHSDQVVSRVRGLSRFANWTDSLRLVEAVAGFGRVEQ